MSAWTSHDPGHREPAEHDGLVEPHDAVEDLVAIRRNVLLSGVVGGLSMLLGIAYLVRGQSAFDVLLGLLLVAIACLHLPALVSARTPVLVADDHGIRLRIGLTWRGLTWGSIRQVVVEYADSPLREGRLVLVPRDPKVAFNHLGLLAEAHLRWNNVWYGAPLSIPLGMTTLIDSADLAADLASFADGRVEIVNLRGRELSRLDDTPGRALPARGAEDELEADAADEADRPSEQDGPHDQPDGPAEAYDPFDFSEQVIVHELSPVRAPIGGPWDDVEEPVAMPAPVSPLREVSEPARVDVRIDPPVLPAQRPAADDDEPTSRLGNGPAWHELPAELVMDDTTPRGAAAEPVIGPRITHARQMLDMSIEELSQRTRIRPHVLEAIEVDDFGPCGGDFYARGHLTAISRALGLTVDPLMKTYDERYAQAPINARRVFEAELSTGLSGGMRATLGGPRWSLLIGSVLCLTMVWGLARIFAGDPEHLSAAPDPSSQAGLASNHQPISSPLMKTTTMTVTAAHAAAHVVVKDRTGKVLWSGDLALGKHRKIVGLAPFTVSADNAGAVDVAVRGKEQGGLGTAGASGTKTFR
ncbi:MAG TPA: RodZ domain-containing protein [Marmoricola sp.]|nr:RodZ domain-containing protein [Marmoricola sp.]